MYLFKKWRHKITPKRIIIVVLFISILLLSYKIYRKLKSIEKFVTTKLPGDPDGPWHPIDNLIGTKPTKDITALSSINDDPKLVWDYNTCNNSILDSVNEKKVWDSGVKGNTIFNLVRSSGRKQYCGTDVDVNTYAKNLPVDPRIGDYKYCYNILSGKQARSLIPIKWTTTNKKTFFLDELSKKHFTGTDGVVADPTRLKEYLKQEYGTEATKYLNENPNVTETQLQEYIRNKEWNQDQANNFTKHKDLLIERNKKITKEVSRWLFDYIKNDPEATLLSHLACPRDEGTVTINGKIYLKPWDLPEYPDALGDVSPKSDANHPCRFIDPELTDGVLEINHENAHYMTPAYSFIDWVPDHNNVLVDEFKQHISDPSEQFISSSLASYDKCAKIKEGESTIFIPMPEFTKEEVFEYTPFTPTSLVDKCSSKCGNGDEDGVTDMLTPFKVTLSQPLGITVSYFIAYDDPNQSEGFTITSVSDEGNAKKTGQISKGMVIISINDVSCRNMSKKEFKNQLKESSDPVELGITWYIDNKHIAISVDEKVQYPKCYCINHPAHYSDTIPLEKISGKHCPRWERNLDHAGQLGLDRVGDTYAVYKTNNNHTWERHNNLKTRVINDPLFSIKQNLRGSGGFINEWIPTYIKNMTHEYIKAQHNMLDKMYDQYWKLTDQYYFGNKLGKKYKEMGVHWPPKVIIDRFTQPIDNKRLDWGYEMPNGDTQSLGSILPKSLKFNSNIYAITEEISRPTSLNDPSAKKQTNHLAENTTEEELDKLLQKKHITDTLSWPLSDMSWTTLRDGQLRIINIPFSGSLLKFDPVSYNNLDYLSNDDYKEISEKMYSKDKIDTNEYLFSEQVIGGGLFSVSEEKSKTKFPKEAYFQTKSQYPAWFTNGWPYSTGPTHKDHPFIASEYYNNQPGDLDQSLPFEKRPFGMAAFLLEERLNWENKFFNFDINKKDKEGKVIERGECAHPIKKKGYQIPKPYPLHWEPNSFHSRVCPLHTGMVAPNHNGNRKLTEMNEKTLLFSNYDYPYEFWGMNTCGACEVNNEKTERFTLNEFWVNNKKIKTIPYFKVNINSLNSWAFKQSVPDGGELVGGFGQLEYKFNDSYQQYFKNDRLLATPPSTRIPSASYTFEPPKSEDAMLSAGLKDYLSNIFYILNHELIHSLSSNICPLWGDQMNDKTLGFDSTTIDTLQCNNRNTQNILDYIFNEPSNPFIPNPKCVPLDDSLVFVEQKSVQNQEVPRPLPAGGVWKPLNGETNIGSALERSPLKSLDGNTPFSQYLRELRITYEEDSLGLSLIHHNAASYKCLSSSKHPEIPNRSTNTTGSKHPCIWNTYLNKGIYINKGSEREYLNDNFFYHPYDHLPQKIVYPKKFKIPYPPIQRKDLFNMRVGGDSIDKNTWGRTLVHGNIFMNFIKNTFEHSTFQIYNISGILEGDLHKHVILPERSTKSFKGIASDLVGWKVKGQKNNGKPSKFWVDYYGGASLDKKSIDSTFKKRQEKINKINETQDNSYDENIEFYIWKKIQNDAFAGNGRYTNYKYRMDHSPSSDWINTLEQSKKRTINEIQNHGCSHGLWDFETHNRCSDLRIKNIEYDIDLKTHNQCIDGGKGFPDSDKFGDCFPPIDNFEENQTRNDSIAATWIKDWIPVWTSPALNQESKALGEMCDKITGSRGGFGTELPENLDYTEKLLPTWITEKYNSWYTKHSDMFQKTLKILEQDDDIQKQVCKYEIAGLPNWLTAGYTWPLPQLNGFKSFFLPKFYHIIQMHLPYDYYELNSDEPQGDLNDYNSHYWPIRRRQKGLTEEEERNSYKKSMFTLMPNQGTVKKKAYTPIYNPKDPKGNYLNRRGDVVSAYDRHFVFWIPPTPVDYPHTNLVKVATKAINGDAAVQSGWSDRRSKAILGEVYKNISVEENSPHSFKLYGHRCIRGGVLRDLANDGLEVGWGKNELSLEEATIINQMLLEIPESVTTTITSSTPKNGVFNRNEKFPVIPTPSGMATGKDAWWNKTGGNYKKVDIGKIHKNKSFSTKVQEEGFNRDMTIMVDEAAMSNAPSKRNISQVNGTFGSPFPDFRHLDENGKLKYSNGTLEVDPGLRAGTWFPGLMHRSPMEIHMENDRTGQPEIDGDKKGMILDYENKYHRCWVNILTGKIYMVPPPIIKYVNTNPINERAEPVEVIKKEAAGADKSETSSTKALTNKFIEFEESVVPINKLGENVPLSPGETTDIGYIKIWDRLPPPPENIIYNQMKSRTKEPPSRDTPLYFANETFLNFIGKKNDKRKFYNNVSKLHVSDIFPAPQFELNGFAGLDNSAGQGGIIGSFIETLESQKESFDYGVPLWPYGFNADNSLGVWVAGGKYRKDMNDERWEPIIKDSRERPSRKRRSNDDFLKKFKLASPPLMTDLFSRGWVWIYSQPFKEEKEKVAAAVAEAVALGVLDMVNTKPEKPAKDADAAAADVAASVAVSIGDGQYTDTTEAKESYGFMLDGLVNKYTMMDLIANERVVNYIRSWNKIDNYDAIKNNFHIPIIADTLTIIPKMPLYKVKNWYSSRSWNQFCLNHTSSKYIMETNENICYNTANQLNRESMEQYNEELNNNGKKFCKGISDLKLPTEPGCHIMAPSSCKHEWWASVTLNKWYNEGMKVANNAVECDEHKQGINKICGVNDIKTFWVPKVGTDETGETGETLRTIVNNLKTENKWDDTDIKFIQGQTCDTYGDLKLESTVMSSQTLPNTMTKISSGTTSLDLEQRKSILPKITEAYLGVIYKQYGEGVKKFISNGRVGVPYQVTRTRRDAENSYNYPNSQILLPWEINIIQNNPNCNFLVRSIKSDFRSMSENDLYKIYSEKTTITNYHSLLWEATWGNNALFTTGNWSWDKKTNTLLKSKNNERHDEMVNKLYLNCAANQEIAFYQMENLKFIKDLGLNLAPSKLTTIQKHESDKRCIYNYGDTEKNSLYSCNEKYKKCVGYKAPIFDKANNKFTRGNFGICRTEKNIKKPPKPDLFNYSLEFETKNNFSTKYDTSRMCQNAIKDIVAILNKFKNKSIKDNLQCTREYPFLYTQLRDNMATDFCCDTIKNKQGQPREDPTCGRTGSFTSCVDNTTCGGKFIPADPDLAGRGKTPKERAHNITNHEVDWEKFLIYKDWGLTSKDTVGIAQYTILAGVCNDPKRPPLPHENLGNTYNNLNYWGFKDSFTQMTIDGVKNVACMNVNNQKNFKKLPNIPEWSRPQLLYDYEKTYKGVWKDVLQTESWKKTKRKYDYIAKNKCISTKGCNGFSSSLVPGRNRRGRRFIAVSYFLHTDSYEGNSDENLAELKYIKPTRAIVTSERKWECYKRDITNTEHIESTEKDEIEYKDLKEDYRLLALTRGQKHWPKCKKMYEYYKYILNQCNRFMLDTIRDISPDEDSPVPSVKGSELMLNEGKSTGWKHMLSWQSNKYGNYSSETLPTRERINHVCYTLMGKDEAKDLIINHGLWGDNMYKIYNYLENHPDKICPSQEKMRKSIDTPRPTSTSKLDDPQLPPSKSNFVWDKEGKYFQRWEEDLRRQRRINHLSFLDENETLRSSTNNISCPDDYKMISISSPNNYIKLKYCVNKYKNNNPLFCYKENVGWGSKNEFLNKFNDLDTNKLKLISKCTKRKGSTTSPLCPINYIPKLITIPVGRSRGRGGSTARKHRLYCEKNDSNNTPVIDGCVMPSSSIPEGSGVSMATQEDMLSINYTVVKCDIVEELCTKKDDIKCKIPDKVCDSSPETCPRKCGLCNLNMSDDYDTGKFYFYDKPQSEMWYTSYEVFINKSRACQNELGYNSWEIPYPCKATKEQCIKDTQTLWKNANKADPYKPIFFNWFNDSELPQDIGICEKFNIGGDERSWRPLYYNTLIDSDNSLGSNYMIMDYQRRSRANTSGTNLILSKEKRGPFGGLRNLWWPLQKMRFWRSTKNIPDTHIVSGMINSKPTLDNDRLPITTAFKLTTTKKPTTTTKKPTTTTKKPTTTTKKPTTTTTTTPPPSFMSRFGSGCYSYVENCPTTWYGKRYNKMWSRVPGYREENMAYKRYDKVYDSDIYKEECKGDRANYILENCKSTGSKNVKVYNMFVDPVDAPNFFTRSPFSIEGKDYIFDWKSDTKKMIIPHGCWINKKGCGEAKNLPRLFQSYNISTYWEKGASREEIAQGMERSPSGLIEGEWGIAKGSSYDIKHESNCKQFAEDISNQLICTTSGWGARSVKVKSYWVPRYTIWEDIKPVLKKSSVAGTKCANINMVQEAHDCKDPEGIITSKPEILKDNPSYPDGCFIDTWGGGPKNPRRLIFNKFGNTNKNRYASNGIPVCFKRDLDLVELYAGAKCDNKHMVREENDCKDPKGIITSKPGILTDNPSYPAGCFIDTWGGGPKNPRRLLFNKIGNTKKNKYASYGKPVCFKKGSLSWMELLPKRAECKPDTMVREAKDCTDPEGIITSKPGILKDNPSYPVGCFIDTWGGGPKNPRRLLFNKKGSRPKNYGDHIDGFQSVCFKKDMVPWETSAFI